MLATIWLIYISKMEGSMSTKEKILDAALTLFAENGYDGTSVEQIANVVGIKAPSLYKHYKGKEDILNALIDSHLWNTRRKQFSKLEDCSFGK